MLQQIGDALKGKKTLSWLILVPLAVVFAIWGATGAVTLDFIGPKTYAAKVDGVKIPLQEASRLWQDQQTEWAQQFNTDIPEDIRANLQDGVIERLIRSELLKARTGDGGYRVDASRLQEAIRSEQAFQVDGVSTPSRRSLMYRARWSWPNQTCSICTPKTKTGTSRRSGVGLGTFFLRPKKKRPMFWRSSRVVPTLLRWLKNSRKIPARRQAVAILVSRIDPPSLRPSPRPFFR
ncbi:MAG: hypothetical protein EBV65_07890 [Gammaproteobacteria bacterium]|nr:hypothetical protein [Gammaproteobacteria bacterium]